MDRSLLGLITCSLISAIGSPEAPCGELRDILGVTHTGGKYCLTTKPYLIEGAEKIQELGSRTIKLCFINSPAQYPFHSQWPEYHSLVELAETPYFKTVVQMPFKTYILETYGLGRFEHYWREGITREQELDEQSQFAELTRHLLATYRGTGKTFILQHWEGDWAIRSSYDANQVPSQQAFDGMIAWLNARQNGVKEARGEIKDSDVKVFHAAEVNLVKSAMEGKPNVTNKVLPHTHLDLVSYSSWDTQSDPMLFGKALDFIAENAPDSEAFGARNVYIGEYGAPENDFTKENVEGTIRNVVETGLQWGCPYIVYWEIYCNEARREPVIKNEDCRGFWLIRPDGTKTWAWTYLHEKMGLK